MTDPSTFRVGDVVYLMSGGPPMTVRYAGQTLVVCWTWNGTYHEMEANPACFRCRPTEPEMRAP